MTSQNRVIVTGRTPSDVFGFTTVYAEVDGGSSGAYQIRNHLAGAPGEIEEILAQSERRMEAARATQAGSS